jgi:hypothetical protein
MRTRITLQPRLIDRVKASSVSFHVDEALINRRTAGDVMHIARTNCGGLAMSVLRRDGLVYAVGAVTAVPLGTGIDVRIPLDVIADAKALFQKHDPECEFPESPNAIRAGNMTSILFRGRREIGPYKIFVKHGHLNGIPGIDECMSIVRTGSCSAEAASVSAILLADPAAVAVS